MAQEYILTLSYSHNRIDSIPATECLDSFTASWNEVPPIGTKTQWVDHATGGE